MKYLIDWKYKPFIALIDMIGSLIYIGRKRKLPKNPKKVLFVRNEHIGDLIMATPTFETFKKANPNCEVHVLCRSDTRLLLESNPYVDETWVYDAPWMSHTYKPKHYTKGTIKMLKSFKYDIVFEMHGDIRNLRLAHKLKSFIIGYGCRGGRFYCNKMMNYNNHVRNISQNLYLISDYCKTIYDQPQLFTPSCNLNLPTNFIVVNPSSGKKEKDLTTKEVEKIINNNKTRTIVLTGLEEDKRFDKFSNVQNWTGKTTLYHLIHIVRMAKKVYAPDTGIVHIAHAVGTPCEAIYKTTDSKVWGY